ncbi:MFS transporter, DHA2 family, multidrug resistance protein [Arboricoccus pini]|uniref:MFS transporter, DHA2 family, multidrug resistance protein n=1 Tax=Arboricoccus pini TaxID=1963835 RepID=A0A212R388_9PROT|nr:DHA2 family efflux MFS transporter permease subunit [Arboricoccus pini]SNB66472.1 MFS transporter, DHA2 family, multidrug resistance protein [Arboricoccus pini]
MAREDAIDAAAKGGQGPAVKPQGMLIAAVVAMAAFMEVLDISIANVALNYIAGGLGASQDEATWVLTSYLVTNAVVLPVSGWLSTLMGRKRFFLVCIIGFSIASAMCGFAPTLSILIVARALQGMVGGGLQPIAQAILADAFPPERRGVAFGIFGMAVVFAPAIGPTLGGWITYNYDWRWIFFLNVPIGIILAILIQQLVKDPPAFTADRERRIAKGISIDYIGFGLLALGLGFLQVMLDRGQQDDWFNSSFIATCAIISAISVVAFVIWEWTSDDPIVDLKLLKTPSFAISNVFMFILGFALFGTTATIPQFVQTLLHYTPVDAGLVISPGGFAIMLMMPIVGRLVGVIDPRYMIAFGFAVSGAALWHMTGFDTQVSYWTVALARIYQTIGIAFLFIPISTVSYVGIPPEKNTNASALVNLMRNLGGSVGISIMQALVTRRTATHQSYLVESATYANPAYTDRLASLQQKFEALGQAPIDANRSALGVMAQQLVGPQAQMLAYIDVFLFVCTLLVIVIPFVFFIKKPQGGGGPVAAH